MMYLFNSKFRVLSGAVGNVILMCRATGHDFTSETEVYLLNQDEISLETTSSRSNNKDGTFNIKRSSHFGFLSRSMERVTLECRVFDRTTNTSLDVTTVELFLPEYQESDCTSQWSPGLDTVILLLMNVFLIFGFITLKRTESWESVKFISYILHFENSVSDFVKDLHQDGSDIGTNGVRRFCQVQDTIIMCIEPDRNYRGSKGL
ncbi:hypothetical protein BSL78_22690 [Apostichopus japonicus]|uniref:Uncharacterized protein n=1 Tax=Stichopus japonicus TaxID=307972 RepID=A0A2G8JXJ9_STIJA|nr:hypothetical protein BSL78_22690 [Apostichopus japonicus]